MADQLLFRGGNTTSIAGSTVSNREIVIDTETNQIVLGSQKDRTVMQDGSTDDVTIKAGVAKLKLNSSSTTNSFEISQDGAECLLASGATGGSITLSTTGGGAGLKYVSAGTERFRVDALANVYIGGTIDSDPAITLTSGGSGLFSNHVTTSSYFRVQRDSNAFAFQTQLSGVQTGLVKSDGTTVWSGNLQVGGNPASGGAAGTRLKAGGGVQACATGTSTNVWAGFVEGTSTSTSAITAAGAAEFDSYVQSGDQPAFGGGTGVRITANGAVTAGGAQGNDKIFAGYKVGTTDPTVEITAIGNGIFAGNVTAANITAFKNELSTKAAAASDVAGLKAAIADALALL